MNHNHIIDMLDDQPIAGLNEAEKQLIQTHVDTCESCGRAYRAALLSATLLKERVDEAALNAANANPFFQTRVLAAWRERSESGSALRRLWNATGALVASMAATTAALAVLTFVVPASDGTNQTTAALVPYSAEAVVLDQSDTDLVTDDQVLSAIYADDDDSR
jgi:hypothetical protein